MQFSSLKSFFLFLYSTRALDMLREFRFCGFVTLTMCVLAVNAGINDTLTYWETLTVSRLRRRTVKRGTTSAQTVEFDSFGRHFALILRRNLSILAPGFQAFVFEADGTSRKVRPDFDLYRGTVDGDSGSFISAYFNADRALSASIRTSTETYSVEPAGNLVPGSPSDSMIIYRESDLKLDNYSRCGYVEDDENSKIVKETISEKHHTHHNRSKRLVCKYFGKTCLLYIAADPRFVRGKGRHSIKETSNYMVKVIDFIDNIFRITDFPECGTGFGFRVMKMNIFQGTTKGYQYTDLTRTFNYLKFLQVFGEDAEHENVCHGHVFTQQSFIDEGSSVLGLAFLASPVLSKVGGVCSRSKSKGLAFSKNVGWTTYAFEGERIVSDLQGTLVTAHEFGHSWGAYHDPDTNEECSPKSSKHGKYLMYPISVSGRAKNNYYFSQCSVIAMGDVLRAKADCFVTKKQAFCGNFLVEAGEQCDAGITSASSDIGNKCCGRDCQLKPNAVCSNANHACCSEDCQIISNTSYPCYLPREDDCFETTFCDGVRSTCPALKPKPYGSACSLKGECRNGVCVRLCELHNYESCMCDEMSDGCKWCCIHGNGQCEPLVIREAFTYLPAGTVCVGGICDDDGICTEKLKGIVSRLWELLDLSSPGDFVRFMGNNFVPTIIVLTLLLWFPASCYVCYLDRRAKNQRLKLLNEVVDEVLDGKIPGFNVPLVVPASHEAMLKDTMRKLTVEANNSLLSDSPPSNSKEQTSAESQAVSKDDHEPKHETKEETVQKHKHEHSREDKLEDTNEEVPKHTPKHKHKHRREHTPENKLEHTDEQTSEHTDEPTRRHKHKHKHKSKQKLEDTGKDLKDNDT